MTTLATNNTASSQLLTRYRWVAAVGAAALLLTSIAEYWYGEVIHYEFLGITFVAHILYALFGHRLSLFREMPDMSACLVNLTLLQLLLVDTYVAGLTVDAAIRDVFLLGVMCLIIEHRIWMGALVATWALSFTALAWIVPDPQMSPVGFCTIMIIPAGFMYFAASRMLTARATLQDKDLQLAQTQEFTGVGSWEFNLRNGKTKWSDTTRDILEVPDEYEPGADLSSFLVGPQEEHPLYQAIHELTTQGKPFDIVSELVSYRGRKMWVQSRGRLTEENGNHVRAIGVFWDITDTVNNERVLTEAKESAERSARSRADFLANMSHEIRTPMNGVIGSASLLASSNELSESQMEYVRVIQSCGDSLLGLINDVLDFSKIDAGKLELEVRAFDLEHTINGAIDSVAHSANNKGLELQLDCKGLEQVNVIGDEQRLRQVLTNLLSNAVKFTEKGSVKTEVNAQPLENNQLSITFSVIDSGIGISASVQDTLFDAFTQADASTTRQYGGTGLGLAISHELVDLMGGTLKIDSALGEGAAFSFQITMGTEVREKESLAPLDQSAELNTALRVLVAEDNDINQKLVHKMLSKLGLTPNMVANGIEAVEAVQQQDYDVILMDVQMPKMDGMTASQTIRGIKEIQQPYIIALTANALAQDREQCAQAGMDGFLPKPMRLADLTAALTAIQ